MDASVRRQIEGRPVLVLGSAPGATAPPEYDPSSWSLICVNASGRIARDLGLAVPDITVVAAGALRRDSTSNVEMRSAISGLCTETLVIRLLNREALTLLFKRIAIRRRLPQLRFHYKRLIFTSPTDWEPMLAAVIGAPQRTPEGNTFNVSTGIFCCAIALHLGASRVVVAGIDPHSSGHAYSTSNQPRQHVFADQRVIGFLQSTKGVEFRAVGGDRHHPSAIRAS